MRSSSAEWTRLWQLLHASAPGAISLEQRLQTGITVLSGERSEMDQRCRVAFRWSSSRRSVSPQAGSPGRLFLKTCSQSVQETGTPSRSTREHPMPWRRWASLVFLRLPRLVAAGLLAMAKLDAGLAVANDSLSSVQER